MSEQTVAEWAASMAEKKQWLFHAPTFAIGPVEKFYDGVTEKYISINGAPIDGPVLELLTGHCLMADPKVFVEVAEKEVSFYLASQAKLASLIKGVVSAAAQNEMLESTTLVLLASLLKSQLRAIETTAGAQDA